MIRLIRVLRDSLTWHCFGHSKHFYHAYDSNACLGDIVAHGFRHELTAKYGS